MKVKFEMLGILSIDTSNSLSLPTEEILALLC